MTSPAVQAEVEGPAEEDLIRGRSLQQIAAEALELLSMREEGNGSREEHEAPVVNKGETEIQMPFFNEDIYN